MKRLMAFCAIVWAFTTITAQIQLKVTRNDGSVSTIEDFFYMALNDSAKTINLNSEPDSCSIPMSEIKNMRTERDGLPWNLSWKQYYNYNHYMFGYSAIMLVRDVMTDDVTLTQKNYNQFDRWCRDANQGKGYQCSHYVWGYLRDMVTEANQWITACKGQDHLKGLLGAAYASRALLYLDMARMFEFLPNDKTSPISASLRDVTGLTVPIITEDTQMDDVSGYYSSPRATREEMAQFILSDLDQAEKLLPQLDIESHLLPHLDAVYGLKARLYMWLEDYANAQRYARLAIETTSTKPMNKEEMQSVTKGFNDPACWMWGVQHFANDRVVQSKIINQTSWVSNQTTWGYTSPETGLYLCIDKRMYDRIPDTDVRKLLWKSPYEALNQQITWVESSSYGSMSWYLPPYASVKFRPAQGNADDYQTGAASAFPLMRVEEMYFIEAEAAAQQGKVQEAQRLMNLFMLLYRNPGYAFQASDQQSAVEEIIRQKRVELWGEGQTFFDIKRLNLSVTRDYEDSNVYYEYRLNTQGRPAWMNFVFPLAEEKLNTALHENNNPDPSDVYLSYYQPLDEATVRNSIQGNVVLDVPKFIDKIETLPLDSVEQICLRYTLPQNETSIPFELQLQASLSPNFPQGATKILSATTGSTESEGEINIVCATLSRALKWLLKQRGKPESGEAYVYLRIKIYAERLPSVQYESNSISFRASVSENPAYYSGYSYAPSLTASSVGVLDMERLAGQENIKVCNLEMKGEGNAYSSDIPDYPYRINLNLWDMGFNINEKGIVNTEYFSYDPFVYNYKYNWGVYFTGHPAEYPGEQHYQANVACRAERDNLIFILKSDTFDVGVIINRQAWEEYDYPWTEWREIAMKSEMMPNSNKVGLEKADGANVYRLWAPYAAGHNLMLFVDENNNVTMPRQYAYNDTWGQIVYASGTGTYDGEVFDMNVTFANADSTQSVRRHEVYGEKSEWRKLYEGTFYSDLFDEAPAAIYQLLSDPSKYKLAPFILNEDGLVFTWDQSTNEISFEDQETGYNHSTYGMIMARNIGGSYVDISGQFPIFHFYIKYYVNAGSYGTFDDTFTPTSAATNRAPRKKAASPSAQKKLPDLQRTPIPVE